MENIFSYTSERLKNNKAKRTEIKKKSKQVYDDFISLLKETKDWQLLNLMASFGDTDKDHSREAKILVNEISSTPGVIVRFVKTRPDGRPLPTNMWKYEFKFIGEEEQAKLGYHAYVHKKVTDEEMNALEEIRDNIPKSITVFEVLSIFGALKSLRTDKGWTKVSVPIVSERSMISYESTAVALNYLIANKKLVVKTVTVKEKRIRKIHLVKIVKDEADYERVSSEPGNVLELNMFMNKRQDKMVSDRLEQKIDNYPVDAKKMEEMMIRKGIIKNHASTIPETLRKMADDIETVVIKNKKTEDEIIALKKENEKLKSEKQEILDTIDKMIAENSGYKDEYAAIKQKLSEKENEIKAYRHYSDKMNENAASEASVLMFKINQLVMKTLSRPMFELKEDKIKADFSLSINNEIEEYIKKICSFNPASETLEKEI